MSDIHETMTMYWAKWVVAVFIALIVAAVLANAIYVRRAQVRLDAALAQAKAEGAPLTVAALRRPPPPNAENAALAMQQLHADLRRFEDRLTTDFGNRWIDSFDNELIAQQEPQLTALFAEYAPMLDALHEAANRPASDQLAKYDRPASQFIVNSTDALVGYRAAVRILTLRANWLCHSEQWELVAKDIAAMLRLAWHFDNEPMFLQASTGAALRGIAIDAAHQILKRHNVPGTAWKPVEEELIRTEESRHFDWTLASERAVWLQIIEQEETKAFFASKKLYWKLPGWRLDQQAQVAEFFQQYIAANATSNPGSFRPDLPRGDDLAGLVVPALDASFTFHCRDLAQIRVLRAAINIAQQDDGSKTEVQFRPTAPPAADDEPLSATTIFLSDTLLDPFDGQPLRVRRLPEGWLVYSIGQNLQDDAGNYEQYSDAAGNPVIGRDLGVGPFLPAPAGNAQPTADSPP